MCIDRSRYDAAVHLLGDYWSTCTQRRSVRTQAPPPLACVMYWPALTDCLCFQAHHYWESQQKAQLGGKVFLYFYAHRCVASLQFASYIQAP